MSGLHAVDDGQGGLLMKEARRNFERVVQEGDLIGVSGAGHIRALINSTEALLALLEAHHSRLRALERRSHEVDPNRVIG